MSELDQKSSSRDSTPRSVFRLLRRRALKALLVLSIFPILASALFLGAVAWWPYPTGIDAPRPSAIFIEDRNGIALAALVARDGQWHIPLGEDQINPHLLDAVVAVEDSRFYEHHGVDWRSVAMAAWEDVRKLRIARGASTLTMQVQRLRDPRPRTFFNKFEQAVRAVQLERSSSKKQLLVEYANRAPFGGSLVGAGAASWRYFGRPCSQLSLSECALLAGLPQSPNRLRPDRYPQRALGRRNHVLDRMLALGIIDRKQHDEACKDAISANWRALPQDRDIGAAPADGALPTLVWIASHYTTQCEDGRRPSTPGQASSAAPDSSLACGIRGGAVACPGVEVPCERSNLGAGLRTSIDAALQRQTFHATMEHLARLESSGVSGAAVVVLDTQTSQCLASISISRGAESLDLTRRPRSTGSTLKPFIYAAAFEAGVCAPDTMLEDSPTAWAGYEPADYDHKFRGTLTAAEALAESRNIPAMVVLSKVGVEPALGIMEAAGLKTLARSPQRYGLSLAIGGAEASPMELAQAYAMLGRGGAARDVAFLLEEPVGRLVPYPLYSGERVRGVRVRGDSGSVPRSTPVVARPSPQPPQPSPPTTGEREREVQCGLADASQTTRESGSSLSARPRREPYRAQEPVSHGAASDALRNVLTPDACWQTLTCLSGAERTSAISPGAARLHAAWKTGTSTGHRDAWCAVVTRRLTVVVWLGNAGGEGSVALVGADAAAPLALRLIATLDAGPNEPWPTVASKPAVNQPRRSSGSASLAMVSPISGEQFVMDSDTPPERQRVLLRASIRATAMGTGSESRTLWWFVDGQPVGVGEAGAQLWWPPLPGTHEIRVIDAHGHAAVSQVVVR